MPYPVLEYIVLDDHEIEIAFDVFSAEMGDGYRQSALVGSPSGLRTWRLSYPHLSRSPDRKIGRFSEESKADYLWDFFCERMAEGNAPFVLIWRKKRWLVGFTDTKLSYKSAFRARFYTSGIEVGQRREAGVDFNDDGSLADAA